jgi:lysophospholipase L1-like esterase
VFVGACRSVEGTPARDDGAAPPAPPPSGSASPKEAREAAPDAAKVARFICDTTVLDVPVPALVDPKATLAPFYARVEALARGTSKTHVRIGMYGDSNLTADATTGRLRRQLQARFGDGGHGYVALSQPWAWYSHNDVHHDGTWKLFRQIATSTNKIGDGHYGFANIASECAVPGCAAWVSTDPREGAPIGWTASRFDLYYLKRPEGGRFDVALDGTVVRSIDTRSDDFEAAFERFDVPDAHHELKVLIRGHGLVRLYGVALERETPSIQVDSLGTGSLNLEQMTLPKSDTRRAQLQHRAYDLVIIQLGTNVFGTDAENRKNAKLAIDELRGALPGLPILFLSPPDSVEAGAKQSDPRIVTLGKTMRVIAEENDTAFWDYRAAMGGDRSITAFSKKGLAEWDGIHLKKVGDELMADRMLCALWDGVASHVERH